MFYSFFSKDTVHHLQSESNIDHTSDGIYDEESHNSGGRVSKVVKLFSLNLKSGE